MEDWKKCLTMDAREILASCYWKQEVAPKEIDLVFLYPTREIAPQLILEEFKVQGWENVALDDALRLIEKWPKMYWVSCGKYKHNIAFINEEDPTKSLELGYDGMGCPFLDKVKHTSLCYSARRKVTN